MFPDKMLSKDYNQLKDFFKTKTKLGGGSPFGNQDRKLTFWKKELVKEWVNCLIIILNYKESDVN